VTGEMFDPQTAREAGLLDVVVSRAELGDRAQCVARELSSIDRAAHAATKLRVRLPVLQELQRAVEAELSDASSPTQQGTGHPASSDP
jgi:enoyl-CoA hydratase